MTSKRMPVYLVLQTSQSMGDHIDEINDAVLAVYDEFALNPRASDVAALSIISFGAEAHLVQPMTALDQVTAIPVFRVGGIANYNAVLLFLRLQIGLDISSLRADGIAVMRPIVFFIGNGKSTDESWRSEAAKLNDPSWSLRPHIIPISVGSASTEWISDVATISGVVRGAGSAVESLTEIVSALVQTLITSIGNSPTGPTRIGSVPTEIIW